MKHINEEKPLRILHVVTKMDAAGIETLLMNIYRNIDREKIQFDFLTHRKERGFYDNEIEQLGGKIYNVPRINPLKHKSYINSLDSFFKNHKEYMIVHAHLNTYSMYVLRAAKKASIPVRIAHSHISDVPIDFKTPFRIYTKSKILQYTTDNFACSEAAALWLFGNKTVKDKNFHVLNNAIDLKKYKHCETKKIKIKKELNLENKVIVGHVGRFNKQKNHTFLLDVFKIIKEKMPNAVLMLVGQGELENKIKEKAECLNISDNILFMGVATDISNWLQVMDVFVFPSLYEGLGIVTIEAQASSVPCIVSEKIPREAFITDLIESIDLSADPKIWANRIIEKLKVNKIETFKLIKDAGYDILDEVKTLQDFYFDSLNRRE